MPPLRERQKKRARDEARAARWALDNAPQATTTTAPGGVELETLWPSAPLTTSEHGVSDDLEHLAAVEPSGGGGFVVADEAFRRGDAGAQRG